MRFPIIAVCLTAIILTGCAKASHTSAGTGVTFDPVTFFAGHTHSWGVVESRAGAPTEWIVTDSHGEKTGLDRLRMVQHLSFQDGTTQDRDWTLWQSDANRFDATANDMVGTAEGQSDGNMFHWQWVLARSPGNGFMNVTMSQWMYQLADGTVLIRTTISKFGIIIAEVTEQFTHLDKNERLQTPRPA